MYRPPEADEISAPSEAQVHTDMHCKNEPLLTRGCTAIFSTVSFGKAFADAHPSGSGQSKNLHARTQNSSKSQNCRCRRCCPSVVIAAVAVVPMGPELREPQRPLS